MSIATHEHPRWTAGSTNVKDLQQPQQTTLAVRVSGVPVPTPTSANEQYWAARALTAEALLSAQEGHYHEIRNVASEEDAKRIREISMLMEQHKEKYAGLEKLVIALLAAICLLVALVIYLATHHTRHAAQRSRWSLPSHFTIPILSPFTSVVEHETSVIGSRTIIALFALTAGVAYLLIRHRMSHAPRQ
ncbi:hypothetical protein BDZ94DRAFT_1178921 [Collybia nuda]|uniref:Uncharacterized protein n=1 Tax=Collybia nuda TaxID=64659 RepID=A0A9P5XQ73_9AGAR|nr:hypothetical protein BDZ94DRAFT_1315975 [Collybia nuda]KAF9455924.1 hypothetical protein BDZ94DRAFT_1178921 [Collybia nuda]